MYQQDTRSREGTLTAALGAAVAFLLLFPLLASAELDEEKLAKYRKRFLEQCATAKYNENCARYYESLTLKRKSETYCQDHPDDAHCIDLLRQKEMAEEERRAVSVHREIAAYCNQNPDAPRCIKRRNSRKRGQQRAQY